MWKLLVIILLAGCATTPLGKADMPTPINTTIVNNEAHITWIRFDDPVVLEQTCNFIGLKAKVGYKIVACAQFNLKTKKCTIFALNPQFLDDDRMTSLGHEVKHCFDGEYHD